MPTAYKHRTSKPMGPPRTVDLYDDDHTKGHGAMSRVSMSSASAGRCSLYVGCLYLPGYHLGNPLAPDYKVCKRRGPRLLAVPCRCWYTRHILYILYLHTCNVRLVHPLRQTEERGLRVDGGSSDVKV